MTESRYLRLLASTIVHPDRQRVVCSLNRKGRCAGMEKKGFFGSLFDFSFTSFVFPKVISFVYGVVVVLIGLAYAGGVIAAFSYETMYGIGALVLGPVVLCPTSSWSGPGWRYAS